MEVILDEREVAGDPIVQFRDWYAQAEESGMEGVATFVLSTATESGRPSGRAVLLKGIDEDGIVFYTNYTSRKGNEIRSNPVAAATFVWIPIHRQVRFEGKVMPVPPEVSDVYFETRPLGARIAAAASPQSEVVGSRAELDRRYAEVEAASDEGVVRPESWGGYRIVPEMVEFWQGRENRFHDRLRYRRAENDDWIVERLAP